ncbi:MBOAT family protein [Magnetospirillum aberrantis]|uniref:Probable alginate O-acetylase AlgI n=1 Tax=Magnetospirillum aberrantis SpK TaxID=908842 RepID=A0A7C9UZK9_9PROT|nr:MBOAT family protein [Magnetospirillum aberrantis]NFV82270.1 MBOAT family protein [Magnetospirillum aberrantis SpK]
MFASLTFWGLVPLFAGANLRLGSQVRALVLAALSLALILYLNPLGGTWLAALVVAVHLVLQGAERLDGRARKTLIWAAVAAIVVNLALFKYLPTGGDGWVATIGFPLGISFLSFRLIHVLVEFDRGMLPKMTAAEYFLYAFFFPIWIAGPIERVDHFLKGRAEHVGADDLTMGANRVLWGLVKVFFISKTLLPTLYGLGQTPDAVAVGVDSLGVIDTWRYLLVTYLILYCDFSGYSDLAIGLSRLFGFKIVENFAFPFLATNMSDYWRRWHISLAQWCQSYVYMPVLARTRRPNVALFSSFFVMGVWHAASPHWILWGMWHALGVTIYRYWDRFRRQQLKFVDTTHRGYVLAANALTLAWVLCTGAFTSLHGLAPISTSFALLGKAIGL